VPVSCLRGCCDDEATHYKSVSVRSASTSKSNDRDRLLAANLDSYYRLRHQGLRPPQIDISNALERRAVDQVEIDTGHLYKNDEDKRRVREAITEMQVKELTK